MNNKIRPIIVVSKCLGFEPVRYNSQIIPDAFVTHLGEYVDYLPVCPEVEIGLGVPRKPVRIVESKDTGRRLIQLETGRDLTQEIKMFCDDYLSSLSEVDGFIMKNGSPSSGIKDVKIYPSMEKVNATSRGAGFFGGEIIARFSPMAIEDTGRLTNFDIRAAFLTRIFAHATLRQVFKSSTMSSIVNFHSCNKYLLMSYNQKETKHLGSIVANHKRLDLKELGAEYEKHFNLALASTSRRSSNVNVLMHLMGYFKKYLGSGEKGHFLDLLDYYREGKIPLVAVTTLIKSWALKHKNEYLLNQSYLQPFPENLIDVRDSGKMVES